MDSNAKDFELGGLDMAAHMVVWRHMVAVAHAGKLLDMLEGHSLGGSWKQTRVQGHGDVCREVHERHVHQATVADKADEADNCLQEHVRRCRKPDDVVDRVDANIRTEPEKVHDGLENGDTGRRDPENLEIPRLPYLDLCEDMKRSDVTSNRNLTVEEAEEADRSRNQT